MARQYFNIKRNPTIICNLSMALEVYSSHRNANVWMTFAHNQQKLVWSKMVWLPISEIWLSRSYHVASLVNIYIRQSIHSTIDNSTRNKGAPGWNFHYNFLYTGIASLPNTWYNTNVLHFILHWDYTNTIYFVWYFVL